MTMVSDSWTKSKVFITNHPFDPNNRPYVKYHSDGESKIHIIFTDGHPRIEPTNSVYYAYYESGAFYRADGSVITDIENIPFEPKDASVIYQSTEEEGRAWIADVAQDEHGQPVILYTKSPSITDHRYWYAKYDGKQWINVEICQSGTWFPQTQEGKEERETHYFGNMSINPEFPMRMWYTFQDKWKMYLRLNAGKPKTMVKPGMFNLLQKTLYSTMSDLMCLEEIMENRK